MTKLADERRRLMARTPEDTHREASLLELAASLGLEPGIPRVLSRRRAKAVVLLSPEPVVARVVALDDFGARDVKQLEAQVAIARHLAESGQPVVPLAALADPGPHRVGGDYVTFWAFAPTVTAQPGDTGRKAGAALRAIHVALESYPGRLRSVLDEIGDRVDRAAARAAHTQGDRLRRCAERVWPTVDGDWSLQPVHGDAHLGNTLRTRDGVVWNDLEHVGRGPVEWDLACLVVTTVALGRDRESTALALAGYGPFDLPAVDRLVDLRVLEFAALKALDGPGDEEGLDFWLGILEARFADRRSARRELQSLSPEV